MEERNRRIPTKSLAASALLTFAGSLFGACGGKGAPEKPIEEFLIAPTATTTLEMSRLVPTVTEPPKVTVPPIRDYTGLEPRIDDDPSENISLVQEGDIFPNISFDLITGEKVSIRDLLQGKPLVVTYHWHIGSPLFDLEPERKLKEVIGDAVNLLVVGLTIEGAQNFSEFPIAYENEDFINRVTKEPSQFYIIGSSGMVYFDRPSLEADGLAMLTRITLEADRNGIGPLDLWGLPSEIGGQYEPDTMRSIALSLETTREIFGREYYEEFDMPVSLGFMAQAEAIAISQIISSASVSYTDFLYGQQADPTVYLDQLLEAGREIKNIYCRNGSDEMLDLLAKWARQTYFHTLDAVGRGQLDISYWVRNRNVFDPTC